uniref:Ig-like domain-containing protein n=1 Tax=Oryctolagus cuniculus TaxID=9986 RepID=A0A5F9CX08_RABIT
MERRLAALLGFLWIQVCWVRGLQVKQRPSALSVQEGASPTLSCNFSAMVTRVQWFRQNPGGNLISLFFMTSEIMENGRLKSTVNFKELFSTLHITASQLKDSGTYLCAAEAQCTQVVCSLDPNCSWACSPSFCHVQHCRTALGVLIHVGSVFLPSLIIIINIQC